MIRKELSYEILLDNIKNRSICYNKNIYNSIKKIESTYKDTKTYHQTAIKPIFFLLLPFSALIIKTMFAVVSETVGKESILESILEKITIIKEISNSSFYQSDLFTSALSLLSMLSVGYGIYLLKGYAESGGNSYTYSVINKRKKEEILNNHNEILKLLNINSLKNLNEKKSISSILDKLSELTESYIKKEKKEVVKFCNDYIELYKASKNKKSLLLNVKNLISEDQCKYYFLKEELYNKLIDLEKDIDFSKITKDQKTRKVMIKSI
jgi:hemerythrin